MKAFIEKIELYPENERMGVGLSILLLTNQFHFEGKEVTELCLEKETTLETVTEAPTLETLVIPVMATPETMEIPETMATVTRTETLRIPEAAQTRAAFCSRSREKYLNLNRN